MSRKTSVKKRGGYWGLGSVINTAMVPGSLLALQQSYRRKKSGGTKRRGTKRRGTKRRGTKRRGTKRRH